MTETAATPRVDIGAAAAVAFLSAATAVSFCRLFADWDFLRPMLAVTIGCHVIALVLRWMRIPVVLALPLSAFGLITLLGLAYYPDSLTFVLPTLQTWDLMLADLRLVWEQFPTAVAPVPSEGSFAMGATALLGTCAFAADMFAFRAFGRSEAVVPTGVVFIFMSAISTDNHRIGVAALWIGAAVVVVAVLRHSHGRTEAGWVGARRPTLATVLPTATAFALAAGVGAAWLAPTLPGAGEPPLLETRNREGDVTEVPSPLVDIRSRLVNRSDVELFTVRSTAPSYWRISGLSEFDGTVWTPADESLRSTSGAQLSQRQPESIIEQEIRITRLGGNLVPVAYEPLFTNSSGLFWADDNDTLVAPDEGLVDGQVILVTSAPVTPSVEVLQQSTVGGAPSSAYALPGGIPREVYEQARQATAAATTPYEQAKALQDWFQANFTYDLDVQRGHSDDAMLNFLNIRRGYCEQFAGTFAVMARTLGLPARVAVGFTQGDLGGDGTYRVAGRHSHAWAEVWFDGVGWVLFEPTPGRGAPGAEAHTGVAPAQDDSGPDGQATPVPATTVVPPTTSPTPGTGEPQPTPTTAPVTLPPVVGGGTDSGGSGSTIGIIVGLVVLAIGWIVFMPRAVQWMRRRNVRSPHEQIMANWRDALGELRRAGAPALAGSTPLEYARVASPAVSYDERTLTEFARVVTQAVYSPHGLDQHAVHRSEQLLTDVSRHCRERTPLVGRLRRAVDPRDRLR